MFYNRWQYICQTCGAFSSCNSIECILISSKLSLSGGLAQVSLGPKASVSLFCVSHLGTPSRTKSYVFLNIVQTAFAPPPPSFLNIYVADFSKGLLKKCVNACRDKCVKIVRKSLGKNVQFTKKL